MQVLRVQHEKGHGPYRPNVCPGIDPWPSNNHPGPYSDFPNVDKISDNHSYGFISWENLVKWFGDDFITLHDNDFACHTFKVPKKYVLIGDHQCAFLMVKAKHQEVKPLC